MSQATVEATQKAKPKRKKPSGNDRRIKANKEREQAAALPPGDEDELVVMRWVMSNPADQTYQQWEYRQWKKDDPEGFRKTLTGLLALERRANRASGVISVADSTPASTAAIAPGSPSSDQGMANLDELLSPENGYVAKMLAPENFTKLVAFLESLPAS